VNEPAPGPHARVRPLPPGAGGVLVEFGGTAARATRLYEQEGGRRSAAPLGLYVRRCTQWIGAGVPTVPALRA
jgi:hypothetical protein